MACALVVVDVLNDYDHPDADALVATARDAVPNIRALRDAAAAAGTTVVYVNDNHGDWTAGRVELTEKALAGREPSLIEPVAPGDDVPLLVKARHSAFYDTQLEYLLRGEDVDTIVLVGQVTEQCILYTALDAHIRHFDVVVPEDACACIDGDLAQAAMRMMESNMQATVTTADELIAAGGAFAA